MKKMISMLSLAVLFAFPTMTSEASALEKASNDLSPVSEVSKSEGKASYVEGEVIVKFKESASRQNQNKALQAIGAEVVPDVDPVKSSFKVLKVGNVEAVVKALNNNPNVEYAEPNYELSATWTPNDPYFSPDYEYGLFTTYTDQAWDVARGDSNQVIAVLDTGVDMKHEDLDDKTIPGYNFVRNNNNPTDRNGHGTHVAGIAAAETNNGVGVAGMAPETSILAVQVLDNRGSGSLDAVADGIVYAADYGAEVINLSLGCDCDTQTLEDAVNYAWEKGSVVVAAAGNDGVSTTFEPASYENVIAVGAVDSNNQLASFSNYGTWVDVVAPGVDIASTYLRGGYVYMSGTSMASPYVAGLAGLLAGQGLDNAEIRNVIESTADPINGAGFYYEHGLINSLDAVNY
ncbi:S8 family serine peptidase [Ornithinibacillus sp. L9]|uniref:S8 family serine peptidase n=1 Tax=Ornithinibacillus caprae TaxID=2678566 RepID=A0A6N8FQ02_9BACI|nr:S8 family peptidase [Ornithinibacillus caprae]MUK90297.1 S8 family serine peptidase [Ornithinibacillus caprae]QWN55350.1 serine protease G3726 [Ornithinibacillus caprae]